MLVICKNRQPGCHLCALGVTFSLGKQRDLGFLKLSMGYSKGFAKNN